MDWNNKSDFEVNKRLAELLGMAIYECQSASVKAKGNAVLICDSSAPYGIREVDYCNSWADIGLLIEKYELKIDPRRTMEKLPYMVSFSDRIWACDKNPRRASAICIIKLLESKQ